MGLAIVEACAALDEDVILVGNGCDSEVMSPICEMQLVQQVLALFRAVESARPNVEHCAACWQT